MLFLRDTVRDNDLIQCRSVDAGYGISTEYAMREQCIDVGGPFFLQQLGCPGDCIGRICQIIDKDTNFVGNIPYKHHCGILTLCNTRWSAFLRDMSVRKFRLMGTFTLWINAIPISRSSAITVA